MNMNGETSSVTKNPSCTVGTSFPTPEEIAVCAYALWESENRPHGRDQAHWFQAEQQLMADRAHQAGLLKTSGNRRRSSPEDGSGSQPSKSRRRAVKQEVVA
jgi:hypothetical protein